MAVLSAEIISENIVNRMCHKYCSAFVVSFYILEFFPRPRCEDTSYASLNDGDTF